MAVFIGVPAWANDILALRIDVVFHQTPVAQALDEVAQKGHFQWSYNAGILENGRLVNFMAKQQSIREILLEILGEEYSFKQNGEYLILKRNKKKQERISGYLSDKKSGKKVPNATIYDRRTLVSTTTDENGYYELEVSSNRSELVVATIGYRDTVLQVNSQTPRYLKIEISDEAMALPKPGEPTVIEDLNAMTRQIQSVFNVSRQKWNIANTSGDSLTRKFQCSFVPNFGTNRYMSGAITNDFSLNILAGYSHGNNILEVGGIGNIIRGHVKGVQVGGVFNTVTERVAGVQIGGVFNVAGKKVKGVQIGGVFNTVTDTVTGVQIGGVFNTTEGDMSGVQIGGVFNVAGGKMEGHQISGVINAANDTVQGAQISGLINYARAGKGKSLQISGLVNATEHGNMPTQVSGLVNAADTVNFQVSGMVNRAKHVKGLQIGLINTANSVDGVQIGLLNFTRHGGYIALEFSANEVHHTNVTLKTGVPRLYTIITGGLTPGTGITEDKGIWSSGIGLGTYFFDKKPVGLTLEAIHRHLNEGYYSEGLQEWEQFTPALNLRPGKHLQLAVGPTFNLLIAKNSAFKDKVAPDGFPDYNPSGDDRLRYWLGGTLAVSFVF
ncbi:MAG: carboxypeptidase-like regulatory domain-containing protein [Saprospiraceae bacterium]|nr:carboxypeptidase-like regulatory domain-containing protein [Saprospiraceae bacterium]